MNTFMQRLRHLQNEAKNKAQWYTKRLPMFKCNIYVDSDNNISDQCKEDNIVKDYLPVMINKTLVAYLQ